MLNQLYELPPRKNPKFQELARQLMSLYPEENGDEGDRSIWLELKADGDTDEPVWNLGLYSGDRLDEVQPVIAARATALGLNVADEQAGDLYLADGRILSQRPGAQCMRAFAAYFSGQFATAWQEFFSLASHGNQSALRNMASMVLRGEGIKQHHSLGHALLVLAGETGEAQRLHKALTPELQATAEVVLQKLRQPGQFGTTVRSLAIPVPIANDLTLTPTVKAATVNAPKPSTNDTIALLLDKARAGDRKAWVYLACAYKSGEGVAQSDEEAVRWWALAAREGSAEAQFNLALSYALGSGVAQDEKTAFKWYGQAADQGHANAIYNFGVMHSDGVAVPKDLVAANILYAYAQVKGYANTPTPTFNPSAAPHVLPLIKEMSESGKVLDTLSKWRRIQSKHLSTNGITQQTALSPAHLNQPRSRAAANRKDLDDEAAQTESSWHRGHVALAVGALQMPIFIWLMPSTAPVIGKLMLGILSLTAAYGAWRVAKDQGFSTGMTTLIVILALVPFIGMFPCIGLLLKLVRHKTS